MAVIPSEELWHERSKKIHAQVVILNHEIRFLQGRHLAIGRAFKVQENSGKPLKK
jgi:hypothetical protein